MKSLNLRFFNSSYLENIRIAFFKANKHGYDNDENFIKI